MEVSEVCPQCRQSVKLKIPDKTGKYQWVCPYCKQSHKVNLKPEMLEDIALLSLDKAHLEKEITKIDNLAESGKRVSVKIFIVGIILFLLAFIYILWCRLTMPARPARIEVIDFPAMICFGLGVGILLILCPSMLGAQYLSRRKVELLRTLIEMGEIDSAEIKSIRSEISRCLVNCRNLVAIGTSTALIGIFTFQLSGLDRNVVGYTIGSTFSILMFGFYGAACHYFFKARRLEKYARNYLMRKKV